MPAQSVSIAATVFAGLIATRLKQPPRAPPSPNAPQRREIARRACGGALSGTRRLALPARRGKRSLIRGGIALHGHRGRALGTRGIGPGRTLGLARRRGRNAAGAARGRREATLRLLCAISRRPEPVRTRHSARSAADRGG